MTNAPKPYPEYTPSGIPFIGEMPAHWQSRRVRHICRMLVSNIDKHTKADEIPVRLCNYVDVYKHERINEHIPFMRVTATPEEVERFRLRIGDVIITKDSEEWTDIGVPALVEFEAPDLLCGYHLAILRPRPELISGAFLFRAFQTQGVAVQLHIQANGVTRYGLSHGAIRGASLPVPPPNEQVAIVQFLDWANTQMERVIRVKRKVIALLREQKQAIVEGAVTRGLDRKVRLKASGISWLAQIPQHWAVLRSKYIFREVDMRSANGEETHLSMSQKLGLVRSSGIEEKRLVSESYAGAKLCDKDDLVLNRLKAHLGVFALAPEHGLVSPDYTVFRAVREVDARYFEAVYRTPACRVDLRRRAKGIVQGFWRLYTDDFYDIRVPVPPIDEQKRIVAQLDTDLAGVNTAIKRLEREIEFVLEYRTRLTEDIIAGKLDVTNVEIPSVGISAVEDGESEASSTETESEEVELLEENANATD